MTGAEGGALNSNSIRGRGADVVLLESGFCGWGGSSRDAGCLTNALAGGPQLLNALHARRLPDLIRYADRAAHFTGKLIGRLDVDCEYEPTGNVIAAVTPGQLRRAGWTRRIGIVTPHAILENDRPTQRGTLMFGTRRLRRRAERWAPARRTTRSWPTLSAASTSVFRRSATSRRNGPGAGGPR
ncbi:FAD-dependent oxidoreductase [Streptomyces sp. NPDC018045]|uniref:FAD-dependent oxidoreductase n=1 Tax=Streptomyces sp. NPDC018045 TaxID=3365037 RepID=UPI0037AFF23B